MRCDADAVILDLEDSIPDGMKQIARRHLSEHLAGEGADSGGPEIWVRVNGIEPELTFDLQAVKWEGVCGAVLPKAERAQSLQTLIDAGAKRVLPIIESAAGFKMLDRLVESGGVERFVIGTLDLAVDLGIVAVAPDDSELIWQLRGELVLASRQLNLPPPVDGIYAKFDDDDGLRQLSQRAYRMGFGAKLIIHPRQNAIVRSVFRPDDQILQHARDVIRAYDNAACQGRGAVQLNGEMIDRPVVERARALLARWE